MVKNHIYATLNTPGTKKVSVCAKRVGSRDRLSVIAVCNDEGTAEKIVDALNALQGKIDNIERPTQRVLEDVRDQLRRAEAKAEGFRKELSIERDANRAQSYKFRELEQKLRTAEFARDAAQKAAVERA